MLKFILVTVLIAVGSFANALTLKERKTLTEWKTYLTDPAADGNTKYFKDKCGYDLPVTIDEKTVTPFMAANASAPSYCDEARGTMGKMCDDDKENKKAISDKIKKVSCHLGKEGEYTLKLNGTELVVTMGVNSSNLPEKIKEFLENNL